MKDKCCRKDRFDSAPRIKIKKDSSIEKFMHYGAWYGTLKEKKHAAHCHPAADPSNSLQISQTLQVYFSGSQHQNYSMAGLYHTLLKSHLWFKMCESKNQDCMNN